MATSVYFNNYQATREQQLFEDLAAEAIRLHGIDVWYLPRIVGTIDPTFNEDSSSTYKKAIFIDMLFKNPSGGFGGFGDVVGYEGLRIGDTATFVVARRTFMEEVGDLVPQKRPFEGDLIYFPLNKKIFRVEFVEHESTFYQAGALQVWELRSMLFDYSGEVIDTGIPEIDGLIGNYNLNMLGAGIVTEQTLDSIAEEGTSIPIVYEEYDEATSSMLGEENDYYQQRGIEIIDWTEDDPFADGLTY